MLLPSAISDTIKSLLKNYVKQDVAEQFGVEAMPTFKLIKKGKEVDKVVGSKKEDLRKKIEKYRA